MRLTYSNLIKPLLDITIAIILLILLSPIIIFVTILLLNITRGRPFFTQERPGKNAKIFKLIKFRTMRNLYDSNGCPLPDKQRITKIGKLIRASSIDELPQLINILKGEMSIVGPRPLLVKYLPLYSAKQSLRHKVKPGITGWTQINGRNTLSWDEKFEMDVWYVSNISLLLDIKIMLITVVKVLKREGINAFAEGTMPPFTGNNSN